MIKVYFGLKYVGKNMFIRVSVLFVLYDIYKYYGIKFIALSQSSNLEEDYPRQNSGPIGSPFNCERRISLKCNTSKFSNLRNSESTNNFFIIVIYGREDRDVGVFSGVDQSIICNLY